jgi:SAM-dependent methyltransferase
MADAARPEEPPGEAQRVRTLARFAQHRQAWRANPALRRLYEQWYGMIRAHLPAAGSALGPFVEIGSGPGFARDFLPELRLSDIVRAPWHDHQIDAATALPFPDASVGALVLFDVLHHLASPARFFAEATRVLGRGGRIVLCEPYIGPLSYPVYRWLHEESFTMGVDPFAEVAAPPEGGDAEREVVIAKDPFDSNQAIPTLMFARARGRATFAGRYPALAIRTVERFAGLSYPASGGFGRAPLLPLSLWRWLNAFEALLPAAIFRAIGFRMLIVVEKLA